MLTFSTAELSMSRPPRSGSNVPLVVIITRKLSSSAMVSSSSSFGCIRGSPIRWR